METEIARETGEVFLYWLDEYGGLKLWAVWGMICTVSLPFLVIYVIKVIGRPLARIAFWLEKTSEEKGP